MELLSLPKLRNHQLQTLTEDTISICNDLTLLEAPLSKVSKKLDLFTGGMTEQKVSTSDKKELDTTRDNLTANFIKAVYSEKHYPYITPEAKNTIETLVRTIDSYSSKINRLNYGDETKAIDNLIANLKKIDFSSISDSGLDRWIPLIELANNNFKAAIKQHVSKASEKTSEAPSATDVVPELMDTLEGLYSFIYAHLKINPGDELRKVHGELEFLLDTYR